jgi:predicted dehydrogenase
MKVGIIGLGRLGSVHLRIYKEIKAVKEIYLCETDPSKLNEHKEYTGFNDYKKMLGKVNLVSIAAPTTKHFEIANFFLKNKVPVLVEKPLTQTLKEAERLIALAKKNKTIVFVGHVERYNSAYLAVKKSIKNPLFIECHRLSPYPYRSLDVSVVLDLMIHDLDIILYLLKDKVKKIEAKGVKVLSSSHDIANARLSFHNGCVANITASRISAKKERKIRIFMKNCYISLDYAQQTAEIYKKVKSDITKRNLPIEKEEPLKREINDFVAAVKKNLFNISDAEKAKDALQLALRIQKAI